MSRVKVQRRALTYALADDIITDYLIREAIPDLLVEVVSSADPDAFAPHPDWLMEQLALADEVIDAVVDSTAHEVVREATRDLIRAYMAREAQLPTRATDDLAVYLGVEVRPPFPSLTHDLTAKTLRVEVHLSCLFCSSPKQERQSCLMHPGSPARPRFASPDAEMSISCSPVSSSWPGKTIMTHSGSFAQSWCASLEGNVGLPDSTLFSSNEQECTCLSRTDSPSPS